MRSESPSSAAVTFEAIEALALSIVIPTHGRLTSLQHCLESIFAAHLPTATEILIVCNGSDPLTEDFIGELSNSDPRIQLIELDRGSPAEARNAALNLARGEVIYFLDDDVTVSPDLFSRAIKTFEERPEIDVLGGPNLTPLASSRFERSVGDVLASRFGAARVAARYRSTGRMRRTDDRALILCNLAIRASSLAGRRPVFGGDLVCNEENLLLQLLERENRGMLHDPALVVYHARRGTIGGFARQIFKYGRGRWQNTIALPSSLSPIFLLPSLFLIYLAALPFFASPLWVIPLAVYGLMLLTSAAVLAWRSRAIGAFPELLVLFPVCHLAYGAGMIYQLAISTRRSRAMPEAQTLPSWSSRDLETYF